MTYSIVARDVETGELGVAVQSCAFNTGAACAWARPGVGAVATQSFTDRRYGWRGLELMAAGTAPADALATLLEADDLPASRQVALLDVQGRSAQHTGADCISSAGHASGQDWAAQANLVDSQRVWEDAGAAFEETRGALALRLLAALDAAEAAGGDWRGQQAAGIVVVPSAGEPWERVIDLRVEDSAKPLAELRRLVDRAGAYRAVNGAGTGRAELARAGGLPDLDVRWAAILDAAARGDIDDGRKLLGEILLQEPRWADYARALDRHPELPSLGPLLPDG